MEANFPEKFQVSQLKGMDSYGCSLYANASQRALCIPPEDRP